MITLQISSNSSSQSSRTLFSYPGSERDMMFVKMFTLADFEPIKVLKSVTRNILNIAKKKVEEDVPFL